MYIVVEKSTFVDLDMSSTNGGCLSPSCPDRPAVAPALPLRHAVWELKVLRKAMQTQELDSGKVPERSSN